jgi:gliding motility-associated-like protein
MYISKLDASGNFIWAKQLGDLSTANTASGSSLKLDASANIYFTGNFTGTIDFDPGPGIYDLNAIGLYGDMFVLRLDKDGNFTSVKQMGGPGNQTNGLGLSLDAFGNIYTSGSFNGIVDFDPGTNTYNLSSTSENDIFVHKMAQCTNSTSSTLTVTDCKNYILNGITYTNSGVYTQTLVNTAGCDSLITLNLTINRVLATVNASSCNNYSWHGKTYNTSGDYIDTFITTGSCDSVITLHLTILPRAFSFITQSICSGQTYGGHNSSGTYIDTLVAANGCDSIITLQLTVLSKPVPYLGADTSLCAGQTLQLYPGSFTTYSWQDGSIQSHYTVKQPGLYSVIVSNNCGSARDDIQVIQNYCDIYFPQAFTPNKDGKNDVFKMLGALNITDYHLTIYNRYGQKIFETTDPAMGWTGEFKGKLQGNDTYAWQCNYNRSGLAQLLKGTIILLR